MSTPPEQHDHAIDARETIAPSTVDSEQQLGPYRLVRRLGVGGMGEVWLGEQLHPLHRHVAIKLIKAGMDTAAVVSRFDSERQALAMMDHPAIARVFDAGITPTGRPYFAMEYVRGEPLTTYCDRQRLPVPDRLELFIQLCEGVQHAHQKGIIHRDLKPSNVLVSIQDDRPVAKVIDFGVAKAIGRPLGEASLTEFGALIGTPEYMSPEQADIASLDIDTRSDVYSLGVLLYELLVGALPFDKAELRAADFDTLRRIIREVDPPRPSLRVIRLGTDSAQAAHNRRAESAKLAKLLRGDLDWISLRALEKDRTRRYQTANALSLDVRRHLNDEPVAAGPPSAIYRAGKFVRRHRFGVAVTALIFVLFVIFSVSTLVQARRIAHERDRANREAEASRQVSDFLAGLFQVSDPSEARGNTLTAREILDAGAQRIEQDLHSQPEVQARLQTTIAKVYTSLGLYANAEALLKRAGETSRRLLGESSPDALAVADALADVYWYQGRLAQAESLYKQVVARREAVLGSNHPDTLKAKFDLGSVYLMQDRDDGLSLIRATLETQRQVLGEDHPDTLASMNTLQSFYFRRRQFADALPLVQTVVDARQRLLGSDHPDTLRAVHNLATIYQGLHRVEDAERHFVDVLARRRQIIGPTHPDTYNTMLRLGGVYNEQRRYREAEALLLVAYQGLRDTLGERHERVRSTIASLVEAYEALGEPAKVSEWKAKSR